MTSLPYLPLGRRDPHRREIAFLIVGFWLATIIIWAAPLPFVGMPVAFLPWFALCTNLVGLALSYVLYAAFVLLSRWRILVRVLAVVGVVLALSTAHGWLDAELVRAFQSRFDPNAMSRDPMALQALFGSQRFVPFYGFMAVTMGLLVTNLAARDQQRRLAQAQADAREAQLAALRLQLNPHFLFNTLNAISTMIIAGRTADADRMTTLLSDFLRSSLQSDATGLVELGEEMDVLSAYLEIEAVRFGERLAVLIDLPDDVRRVMIPGLLLQPIVENAIKHGVAPSKHPVTIAICARGESDRVRILIEDDGAGASASAGTGVGLNNVRDRLLTAFGSAAQFSAGRVESGYRVELIVPRRTGAASVGVSSR